MREYIGTRLLVDCDQIIINVVHEPKLRYVCQLIMLQVKIKAPRTHGSRKREDPLDGNQSYTVLPLQSDPVRRRGLSCLECKHASLTRLGNSLFIHAYHLLQHPRLLSNSALSSCATNSFLRCARRTFGILRRFHSALLYALCLFCRRSILFMLLLRGIRSARLCCALRRPVLVRAVRLRRLIDSCTGIVHFLPCTISQLK